MDMRKRGFSGVGVTGRGVRRERRLAGWCVLGVAGGLAVAACGGPSGGATSAAGGTAQAGAVSHQLRQRIEGAQDPAGYLVKATQVIQEASASDAAAVTSVWTDLATGNAMMQRGSGSARTANWERDYYAKQVLHWDQTQVNYGPRTWWAADSQEKVSAREREAGSVGGAYAPEALVKGVLQKAAGQVVGHPVLGGRATIELAVSVAGARYKVWVDSRTYRVVRTERYFSGAMHLPPMVTDFDWVRASAALLDRINHPQVPSGFKRIQVGEH
jgi:hypothetical protein